MTPLDRLLERLPDAKKRRDGGQARSPAQEVQQGCRWLRGPGLAEQALQTLAMAGVGNWETTPPGTPGRQTRRFVLAKASAVYETPKNQLENADFVGGAATVSTADDDWGEV